MYSSKQIKLVVPILLALISLIFSSCGNNVKEMVAFLNAKEAIYEDISIQMGEAYWNLYSDEAVADLESPKIMYIELFSNDTLNNFIDEWYPKRNKIRDKIIARRIEVWHNILTAAKINYSESNLELQNELEFWFAEEVDAEGRPSQDELEAMVIQLMKQRNAQAKEMGYNNYAELILEITETGANWLNEFTTTIESRTHEPFQQLKIEYLEETGKSEFTNADARSLMMQYYINQVTPELSGDSLKTAMKTIIDGIGINYDNLPFRVVENEMPPGIGGQGIAVQIPNDFRIALMPGLGLDTWMHELGHGLQAMNTSIESPILKGYEWSFGSGNGGFAEGMAETSARFAREIDIAKNFSDLTDKEFSGRKDAINKHRAAYLRYWLMMFMFEVEYYKDLDQDPDMLKRELMQRYRFLDHAPDDNGSVANLVYVSYPLYLQNYIIAEVLSWQIHETLRETFGDSYSSNSEVGEFLKEYLYKNGELLSWQQRILQATGKELDLDGYLTYFGM